MSTKSYFAGGVASSGPQLNFTDKELSPAKGASLWQSFPMLAWLQDPNVAHLYREDFHELRKATDTWILTQATTGTGVAGALAGGVLTVDAGAITDGQGVNMQLAGIDFVPAAGKHIWYETKIKTSFITGDFFFGLAEIDTTIIDTTDMTTANHIGFKSFTGDGVMIGASALATVEGTVAATTTLVAATYVRLGFIVNGITSVTFYVNGVANATTLPTANIPILGLTPSLVVHATGTDRPVVDVDWIQVGQLN